MIIIIIIKSNEGTRLIDRKSMYCRVVRFSCSISIVLVIQNSNKKGLMRMDAVPIKGRSQEKQVIAKKRN